MAARFKSSAGLSGSLSSSRSSSASAPSRSPRASRISARLLRAFTCLGSRASRSRYDAAARSISPRSLASLAATYSGSSATGADDPLYVAAREASERGEMERAAASYRDLLARDPKHVKARNNLALILDARGDRDGALAELDRD